MAEMKKTSIGGQALIEGVMMRGPQVTAMAVRHQPTGEIRTEKWENAAGKRPVWYRIPIVRGLFNFVSSMILGYKCLMKSVEMSGMEEIDDEEEKAKKTADQQEKDKKNIHVLMTVVTVLSSIRGVAISIFLFMWLPIKLFDLLKLVFPALHEKSFLQALFEGIIRMVLFLCYMLVVSQMKDIKRVFAYHGSEHKTIFCYEKGLPLTVENVRKQTRFHPRCGTSFMVLMVIVGVFISMLIPTEIPPLLRTGIKILTIPLVMGFGYELIKLAGRYDNVITRIISAPGLWMQRITTKEPTDDMIECAIAAFEPVIPEDENADKW